jgi:hypothetical protein
MRINHVQRRLIKISYKKAKLKYPDIKYRNLQASPDDPEHIWVNVVADMDDDKELEFIHFSAVLDTNIFSKYGYRISLMLESPNFAVN